MTDHEASVQSARRRRQRGIFERPKGSGTWWARYHDEHGREHREKVGPKGLAVKVYQKRKNEIAERRFFPERIRSRDVLLTDLLSDYLVRVRGKLRSIFVCNDSAVNTNAGALECRVRPCNIELVLHDARRRHVATGSPPSIPEHDDAHAVLIGSGRGRTASCVKVFARADDRV